MLYGRLKRTCDDISANDKAQFDSLINCLSEEVSEALAAATAVRRLQTTPDLTVEAEMLDILARTRVSFEWAPGKLNWSAWLNLFLDSREMYVKKLLDGMRVAVLDKDLASVKHLVELVRHASSSWSSVVNSDAFCGLTGVSVPSRARQPNSTSQSEAEADIVLDKAAAYYKARRSSDSERLRAVLQTNEEFLKIISDLLQDAVVLWDYHVVGQGTDDGPSPSTVPSSAELANARALKTVLSKALERSKGSASNAVSMHKLFEALVDTSSHAIELAMNTQCLVNDNNNMVTEALVLDLLGRTWAYEWAATSIDWQGWFSCLTSARLNFVKRCTTDLVDLLARRQLADAASSAKRAHTTAQIDTIYDHSAFREVPVLTANCDVNIALGVSVEIFTVIREALSATVVVWALSVAGQPPRSASTRKTPRDVPDRESVIAVRDIQTRYVARSFPHDTQ